MYVMLTLCSMHSGRGHWAAGRGGYLVTLVIIEILLCHINNFSSYTLKHVWWKEFDFSVIFLSFCPSTHKERIFWIDQSIFALFFSQNFRIIFRIFLRNLHIIFSHFSRNICIFVILFFAKQIKAKFLEKKENFRIFREKTKCEKNRTFSRTIFPIRCKP